MFQMTVRQPLGLVGRIPFTLDKVAEDTTSITAVEYFLHLILCCALNLYGRRRFGSPLAVLDIGLQQRHIEDIMDVYHLLRQFEPIGLPAHALNDRIGSVKPMVELFARSLHLYVFTRQPDHVAHGEFSRLCTPISVLTLCSRSLLPALF
jgi:hypothetical protein